MNPITVLLAEDHTIVREGLRTLLEAEGDISVVGEAGTGRKAVDLAKELRPSVVVMDIAMPLLNGLEATRRILKTVPDTKVLILSAHSDEAYVDQVVALGASGYLLKQTSAHVLSQAVREVHGGKTFFSPPIAKCLHNHYEKASGHRDITRKKGIRLTPREVEVIQLIAEGRANKQVAAELGISVKTVEKHRQRIMDKLNIHDTAGLTRYAMSAGIIESNVRMKIV